MRRLATLMLTLAALAAAATPAVARSSRSPVLGPHCIPHYGCSTYNTKGFGEVRPTVIYLGGDGTGVICRIHWITWGGVFAIGVGIAADVVGHQDDAHAQWSPAVVIASYLGDWRGRPAYRGVRWTFPDGERRPESRACAGF